MTQTSSAANSTVVAASGQVPADDTTTDVITVTLRDAANNPVNGHTVTLADGGAINVTINPASGVSNASGQVTFTVRSDTGQTATFTATDTTDNPDTVITQTADVLYGDRTTQFLANLGDTASFKVYVILTTANEAGSNTVTITRPVV